jgi:Putative zinc-finger
MSADCETARDLFAAMLLSEAGREEAEGIRRHLATCDDCREEFRRQAAILGTLSSTEVPDPGGAYWNSFLPRLRNRIEGDGLASGPAWKPRGWAVAASLAVLVLGAAAVVGLRPAAGIRSRMAVNFIAAHTSPGTLRQALDELLPGSEIASRPAGKAIGPQIPKAAELQRALDSLVPPEESDIYSAADGLSPEARRYLLQALIPDRV